MKSSEQIVSLLKIKNCRSHSTHQQQIQHNEDLEDWWLDRHSSIVDTPLEHELMPCINHQPLPNFKQSIGGSSGNPDAIGHGIEEIVHDRTMPTVGIMVRAWWVPNQGLSRQRNSYHPLQKDNINKVCLSFWTYHVGHSSDRDPTSKKYQMVFQKNKQFLFNTALISTKIVYLSGTL